MLAWPNADCLAERANGLPVEPRNLVRAFWRICEKNKIRVINVHHLRRDL